MACSPSRRLRDQHLGGVQHQGRAAAPCSVPHHQRPASRGEHWTDPYRKVCAAELVTLDDWVADRRMQSVAECGTCRPNHATSRPIAVQPSAKRFLPPSTEGHYFVHGPTTDEASVQAWATDYVRFERLPPWQRELRQEIGDRCRQLDPVPGQVLHATFFGPKFPNADVENLVLYNIGTFNPAGSNGIRFEYGHAEPRSSNEIEWAFSYRYALGPRSDGFSHWHKGRSIASFDWTDLGHFRSEKQLAQVWLALWRAQTSQCMMQSDPNAPFGIRVEVRPPEHRKPVWSGLMKGIIDGVICAFQAHGSPVDPEVLGRLADSLRTDPGEIEKYLLDRSRSVLGLRPRLVSRFKSGVKWDPPTISA